MQYFPNAGVNTYRHPTTGVSVANSLYLKMLHTTTDTLAKNKENTNSFFCIVFVLASVFTLSFEKRISLSVRIIFSDLLRKKARNLFVN